ncbi:malto-oligosyltrehalose synthase [Herpetosiphon geysericola]|uniref:Glycosyl hydrolase family 13 catalytic domain-containing protein n=1 Tax=Herpetosiphon geysericola TaxID=70996 RepID=A0A0N8GRV3_9CHLR|nr:malto-oligosyltrehalose synthase [Herpetosiphon geysericola]KPL87538.1 hypothetical protein SE18_10750 [Herpetosiphon geysericola]
MNQSPLFDSRATSARLPLATYRFQLHADFTFFDAAALVPYLHQLGISDCYVSPIFTPRAESTHGYDICSYGELTPWLGGTDGFWTLANALNAHGMGLIVDMVPNHMGIGAANAWWMDVLENGISSVYAPYFDIDWQPSKRELANQVLLPILGDHFGVVIEQGAIQLHYDQGAFFLQYAETRLPIAPRTAGLVLEDARPLLEAQLPADDPGLQEFLSILTTVGYLPPRGADDPLKLMERRREKEIIKGRLASLTTANATVRRVLDQTLGRYNGNPDEPASFTHLTRLLDGQAYRLAFWQVSSEEINYRRFFDINELAAIRVEHDAVFRDTHTLLFDLIAAGAITGLRIDHPDGLWMPAAYFARLQTEALTRRIAQDQGLADAQLDDIRDRAAAWVHDRAHHGTPDTSATPATWPLYVVAEKILAHGEALPQDWALHGTTGYDFLNAVNGIFVDSRHGRSFDTIYSTVCGTEQAFSEVVLAKKMLIMQEAMASEIASLSYQLERLTERTPRYRDFTLGGLTTAIRDLIAHMPIYRTYIDPIARRVSDHDRQCLEQATDAALRQRYRTSGSVLIFLRDTLLLRTLDTFAPDDRDRLAQWILRFQQMTGPIMAKGVEDTAFYLYNRLISLNEVGGEPALFGQSLDAFHRQNQTRHQDWPSSMLTLATHDTKRAGDVRARINVLSEIPKRWWLHVNRWRKLNATHKIMVDGVPAPDANDEYLLYQTLLGAWPAGECDAATFATFRDRIISFMQKATREAKTHTSWVNPNADYDASLTAFVTALLPDDRTTHFLADFIPFQQEIARVGAVNSLSQTLFTLTAPGVPDCYQGSELWDFSLVDPDNRRPIDYALRQWLLGEIQQRAQTDRRGVAQDLLEHWADGRMKLFVITTLLTYRRANPDLFLTGRYTPLTIVGPQRTMVCAYTRQVGDTTLLVVGPRLVAALMAAHDRFPLGAEVWQTTRVCLPATDAGVRYRNLLTCAIIVPDGPAHRPTLALGTILCDFPIAALEAITSDEDSVG